MKLHRIKQREHKVHVMPNLTFNLFRWNKSI